ncbi:uncharacterized protein LOC135484256 [Lineus longissimus]|uniref:uncharacterized protein LOC135484256 n=1 Tax=Lineus longissimus TaxID=88925 RepID=UPI002B4FA9B0
MEEGTTSSPAKPEGDGDKKKDSVWSVTPAPSDNLTEEQIAEYRETFALFDKDRDGYIHVNDMAPAIRSLGQNPTETEIAEMKVSADKEHTNTVDFPEFLSCMSKRAGFQDTEDDLIEAFSVFDRECIGKISAPELRHAMTTLGEKLNDEQADQLIQDADTDGTGQIDINAFIKLILELK